jgi:hypothetical protein
MSESPAVRIHLSPSRPTSPSPRLSSSLSLSPYLSLSSSLLVSLPLALPLPLLVSPRLSPSRPTSPSTRLSSCLLFPSLSLSRGRHDRGRNGRGAAAPLPRGSSRPRGSLSARPGGAGGAGGAGRGAQPALHYRWRLLLARAPQQSRHDPERVRNWLQGPSISRGQSTCLLWKCTRMAVRPPGSCARTSVASRAPQRPLTALPEPASCRRPATAGAPACLHRASQPHTGASRSCGCRAVGS